MLNLIILNGPHKGDAIAIAGDRPTILGRQGDVTLKDSRVSRKHAEVRNESGTWVITDLGSANGTLVNGRRINKLTELEEGDQIQMGRYLVVVGHMDGIDFEADLPGEDEGDIASAVAASAAVAPAHDLGDEDDALPDFDDLMADDEDEHPIADDSPAASAMAEPDQDGVYDLIMGEPAKAPDELEEAETADEPVAEDVDGGDIIDAAPAAPTPQPMPTAPPTPAPLPIDDVAEDDDDGVFEYPADEPVEQAHSELDDLAAAISDEEPAVPPVDEQDEALDAPDEVASELVGDTGNQAPAVEPAEAVDVEDDLDFSLDDAEVPPVASDLEALELDLNDDSPESDAKPDPPIEALDAALDEAFTDEPEAQAGESIEDQESAIDAVDLLDDQAGRGDETVIGVQVDDAAEDDDAPPVVSLAAAPADDRDDDDDEAAARIDDASVNLVSPADPADPGPDPAAGSDPDAVEPAPLVNPEKGWGKTIGLVSAALVLLLGLGAGYYIVFGPGLPITGRDDTTLTQNNNNATEPEVDAPAPPPIVRNTPGPAGPTESTAAVPQPPIPQPQPDPDTNTAPPTPLPAPPPVASVDTLEDPAPAGEPDNTPAGASDTPVTASPPVASAFTSSPNLIGEGAIVRAEPATRSRVEWLDPEPAPADAATVMGGDSPFQPVTSPDDVIAAAPATPGDATAEVEPAEPVLPPADEVMAIVDDERIDELTDAIGPPRRVVFLVDASGSLIDTFDQVLNLVSTRVRGLLAEQEFTVVFFRRGQVIESPPAGLKPANPRNKRLVVDWLNPTSGNIAAFGRSEVDEAIALALSYGADEITLFSDNALARNTASGTDGLIDQIEELFIAANERPVVNTVQFIYDDPENTLRRIAEEFDGEFLFIKPTYGNRSLLRWNSDELSIVPMR